MKYFARRRGRNLALLITALLLLWILRQALFLSLRDVALASGWLLLIVVLVLAAYNVRKKLPFLPLGSSAAWLQFHVYLGLLSAVVFGSHVGWRWPDGVLESVLASLYTLVFVSGVLGLILSRVFARRLTSCGPEILYDRIPRLRNRLKRDVERLVLECVERHKTTAVPDFHARRLAGFFSGPRHFLLHLAQSARPRRGLLAEFEAQRRFLDDGEIRYMERIADRVTAKVDLDYQYAHQAVLKYWLFLHVPLTYALLVFAVTHAVLVHAFRGHLT